MARRQKRADGIQMVLILGLLVLLAMIPTQVWIALAGTGGIWLVYRLYKKIVVGSAGPQKHEPTLAELTRPTVSAPPAKQTHPAQAVITRGQGGRSKTSLGSPIPQVSTTQSVVAPTTYAQPGARASQPAPPKPTSSPEFYAATLHARNPTSAVVPSRTIPSPPAADAINGRWIGAKQGVKLGELMLPGGLFYVGHTLESPSGGIDPCLINLHRTVARDGDFTIRQMDYWPSYSDISPAARRAYLNWLADGRKASACDIGFVFLFFYGLERRVLFDGQRGFDVTSDLPAIASELRRLIAIYGETSRSFRRYATGLLDWIELTSLPDRLYERPIPSFLRSNGLPIYLRLALGQTSRDCVPVPAPLALQWARANPAVRLWTAARRCAEVFDRLFLETYNNIHGAGVVLPKNRTKLKFVYQPASSGLRNLSSFAKAIAGTPDVTVLRAPILALQKIADQCAERLGSYNRMVGRDPAAGEAIEGLLCLPPSLWPERARRRAEALVTQLDAGPLTLSIDEVLCEIDPSAAGKVSRDTAMGAAKALHTLNVGMEPNLLEGARAPKTGDPVVLFKLSTSESATGSHNAYQVAVLTLQLASAVARADGNFDAGEVTYLEQEIERWAHLAPAHRLRLHAHLQWLGASTVTLARLKAKLKPLDVAARETIASLMVTLVHVDGVIAPKEISLLEKVYKALGLDPRRLSSDVHSIGTGVPSTGSRAPETGFRLDAARIAALQRDTEEVSALLADIFVDEEAPPAPADDQEDGLVEPAAEQLLGLDDTHAEFARLLLSRPQWSRSELEDAAADMDLMLDGALELVNEAAFDAYDEALIEGEDPMDVNKEIKEALAA